MRGLVIGLALLGLAQTAAAQDLVPGAQLGMTVAEIRAARDAAREADGERLVERGVAIGGHQWDARYQFSNGALSSVVLTPVRDTPGPMYQAMFDAIVGDLASRFGEPFTCAEGPFVGKQECDWREAGSRIAAQLVTSFPLLEITHTRRAP